jgi:hypothetical protein
MLANLRVSFATRDYDRTTEIAILIPAWTMDEHDITPAQCKALINEYCTMWYVTFCAVKITYGYDPDEYTASYVTERIHAWVDYFDDYYSTIYVASRTVFHSERKLTSTEADNYYRILAGNLSSHSSVKCFLGEEEPEATQLDPYTSEEEGNGVAYSGWVDMSSYVDMLYDTWNTYSSIPFSFESIPPQYDFYNYSGHFITNPTNWFFETCDYDDYWDWIDSHQEIFAIDEWRYHSGVGMWADHVDDYNVANEPDRKIFLGETFSETDGVIDVGDTEELMDAFNNQYRDNLNYAFWWQLCGSEYVPSESEYAPEDYVYWDGGYKGHCWAFLYMKTCSDWGLFGDGLVGCQTCTNAYNDQAFAYMYPDYPITYEYEFQVRFNLDMSMAGANYEQVLGYWDCDWFWCGGLYYSITAKFDETGDIDLRFYYIDDGYGENYYTVDDAVVENCWNYAKIYCNGDGYMRLTYGYEDDGGVCHTSYVYKYDAADSWQSLWYVYGDGYVTEVLFGCMGGIKTKMWIGEIGVYDGIYGWEGDDFDDVNINGWSTYTSGTLSRVTPSDEFVPSYAPMWLIEHLKDGYDY